MTAETRYVPLEEREILEELPNTTSRGAPKVWEYRLREIMDKPGWHCLAEGPRPAMFAMKSNFKYGRMSQPKNEKFECEVVAFDDPEKDNLAMIYFRYLGPITEQDKQDAAKQKLVEHLRVLEEEINTKGTVLNEEDEDDEPSADVDPGELGPVGDPASNLVVGDPHGDRESLDPDDALDREAPQQAFSGPSQEELLAIQARMVPLEDDPTYDSGLDEL